MPLFRCPNRILRRLAVPAALALTSSVPAALAQSGLPSNNGYRMRHISVRVQPDFVHQRVAISEQLTVSAQARTLRRIVLDCDGPPITTVNLQQPGGASLLAAKFSLGHSALTVKLPHPLAPGQQITLLLNYDLQPAAGLVFFPGELQQPSRATALWTSGEPDELHHWLPADDHPNDKLSADFTLVSPPGMWGIANGALVGQRTLPDGSLETHWVQAQPISSYLLTFYIGSWKRIDDTTRLAGRLLPLEYDVPVDFTPAMARTYDGRTPEMIRFFSKLTGIPFPWAKYDQVNNPGFFDALENVTATEFPGDYPENPDLANLLARQHKHDITASHELAHHWFGDLVTCQDWSQVWLNEGFAQFSMFLWDRHAYGADRAIFDRQREADQIIRSGAVDLFPVVDPHYGDPWNMFRSVTYVKGAWALRRLEYELGPPVFWRGIHAYLSHYQYRPVNTAEFERAMERASGTNLQAFFKQWLYSPGHPQWNVSWSWDAAHKNAVIRLQQQRLSYWGHVEVAAWSGSHVVRHSFALPKGTSTFTLPLPSKPRLLQVDPQHTWMVDLHWTKTYGEWLRESRLAPYGLDRRRALNQLLLLAGPRHSKQLPRLLKDRVEHDPSPAVRQFALGRLSGLDLNAALTLARRLVSNQNPELRAAALRALGHGPANPPDTALVTTAFHSDPVASVRVAALNALATMDRPHLSVYIQQALAMHSFRWQVESAALKWVSELGTPAALPILHQWATATSPQPAREVALQQLGALGSSDPQTLQLLRSALNGPLGETQVVAAFSLARLKDRQSLPIIENDAQNYWIGFFKPAFARAAQYLRTNK